MRSPTTSTRELGPVARAWDSLQQGRDRAWLPRGARRPRRRVRSTDRTDHRRAAGPVLTRDGRGRRQGSRSLLVRRPGPGLRGRPLIADDRADMESPTRRAPQQDLMHSSRWRLSQVRSVGSARLAYPIAPHPSTPKRRCLRAPYRRVCGRSGGRGVAFHRRRSTGFS